MAEADAAGPPSIAALPAATVRQLGASNVLRDPSSVVKELIDNALDARTNAVFVDIAANTLDSIQVKDTGHGISTEDRPLVCRRYCTSKIRDFHDLHDIGGKWLGFRGEALASMAEMSGTLEVTTRVEGEPVAVKLKYGRDGELVTTERASAPVGTTVKVTSFFNTLPVRREAALKDSAKILAKIKRLMQAYAFARPAVRFSLRVLKAKSNKGDFVYAPKKDANVEDAVLKIIGKNCALQCDWTAIDSDGFEIHAFLPKPNAVGAKIANEGAFLSVDGRPLSTSRGTPKKIVAVFKERLRRANPDFGSVKDPFFCMNIICPPGSYDPNIEPAKDDVLFEDSDVVLHSVNKLFLAYYPEVVTVHEADDVSDLSASAQGPMPLSPRNFLNRPDAAFSILGEAIGSSGAQQSKAAYASPLATIETQKRPETAFSILEEAVPADKGHSHVHTPQNPPRWRSSMYGIDEEDLDLLSSENQPPVIEEEEDGRRDVSVSNPWIIARMNASIKPKTKIGNGQLMTPAKDHGDVARSPSSPLSAALAHQRLPSGPLTPQTLSRTNMQQPWLSSDTQQNTRSNYLESSPARHAIDRESMSGGVKQAVHRRTTTMPLDLISSSSPAPRRSGRHPQTCNNRLTTPDRHPHRKGWTCQPMHKQAPFKLSRPRNPKRNQNADFPVCSSDSPHSNEAEHIASNQLISRNNTDIRDFFRSGRAPTQRTLSSEIEPPSFTPINRPFRGPRTQNREQNFQQQNLYSTLKSRASSSEPPQRRKRRRNPPQYNPGGFESLNFTDQLRTYAERDAPPRSRARASSLSPSTPLARASAQTEMPQPPTTRPRTTDAEMAAKFSTYCQPPNSPSRPARPQQIQPSQETARPTRRRATDPLHRRRSSRLPLERVPSRYRIQNVVLPIKIDIASFARVMRKMDMRRNSVEWGYPADASAYDAFSTKVTNSVLQTWVMRVDGMLEHFDTQFDREAVLMTLERGVAEALRERQDGQEDATTPVGTAASVNGVDSCSQDVLPSAEVPGRVPQTIELPASSAKYRPPPLDEPQTVNPGLLVTKGNGADEFGGDDFEEMLMDF